MKANAITFMILISTFMFWSNTNLQSLKNTVERNYQLSSRQVKIRGSVLSGLLKRANWSWTKSVSLDLNKYVGNKDGHLVWGSGFKNTCKICFVFGGILNCSCKNSKGKYLRSDLNIAMKVTNTNGKFTVDK